MGLSLLFATSMFAICGYIWRIRSSWLGSKAVHITTIVLLLIIAAAAFLFGAKFNGETLLYVAAHGMPNWSGFGLQRTWAWVFLPVLGVAYIQIWTLVRALLNTTH